MVSLYSGPISSFASLNSYSDTLLPLPFLCTWNPRTCKPLRLLAVGLEVKPGMCTGVLRMCSNRRLDWDCEESKDLETEILEFMNSSEKPGMFPSKEDLIRCGRSDLVERIVNQGGWLSMGWDLEEQPQENNHYVTPNSISQEIDLSSSKQEVDVSNESGIEGILTRLEKDRNLSLGISLRESNGTIDDASLSRSSMIVTATEFHQVDTSTSSAQNRSHDTKSVDVSNSPTSDTWRTWSMRRAGFTDEDFQAAEISSTASDITNEDSDRSTNGKDETPSSLKDINTTHIKSRLQHLQSELSSVLHSLRSPPDEGLTRKDSEINSGNLETVYDDWEFKENEIMYAQNKLRSTQAKLAVLEGKMAMAIIDAQRIVREKQRRIDHASRALRLLRTTSIVWPNSASEVLLTGSFDGWSTQRKMKKAENGVFSLSLKLYPGKYEIKFIVDGQWKVDPLRAIVTCNGYENNLLFIS